MSPTRKKIGKLPIFLRRAEPEDSRFLFKWRNDLQIRRYFFNSGMVKRSMHEAWFKKILADPDVRLFIIETKQRKRLGQLRLDRVNSKQTEVSISLDSNGRGRGIAVETLKNVPHALPRLLKRRYVAHVKPANIGSAISFLKAGFEFKNMARVKSQICYRMEKT